MGSIWVALSDIFTMVYVNFPSDDIPHTLTNELLFPVPIMATIFVAEYPVGTCISTEPRTASCGFIPRCSPTILINLISLLILLYSNLSQDGTMAHYNTSQLAMDEIYSWIMNSKNTTMNSKMVHCNYAYDTISGELNSGSFLLIGFRNGSYAHITAHSYWKDRAISIGTIEDGAWASRFLLLYNKRFQYY